MKPLLIFLIYFAASVYTIENDVFYENCSSEIRKEQAAVNKCIGGALNFDVTQVIINTTKSIKGNESTSEEFVAKYCPNFKQVYSCANLFRGGANGCRTEPSIVQFGTETNITTTIMMSIIDLVCNKDGAKVVDQCVSDDLLTYVGKQSESLRDCMYLFEDRPFRYRNRVQKHLFLKAVNITTSCVAAYFKTEGKHLLKDLTIRLGLQLNRNLKNSIY